MYSDYFSFFTVLDSCFPRTAYCYTESRIKGQWPEYNYSGMKKQFMSLCYTWGNILRIVRLPEQDEIKDRNPLKIIFTKIIRKMFHFFIEKKKNNKNSNNTNILPNTTMNCGMSKRQFTE